MFKKKPNIKPYAPVRSSDRRKLLVAVFEAFSVDSETLPLEEKELLVPSDIQVAKFIAHSTGETGTIYVGGNRPLWLKLNDGHIVPTVFTLWKCPYLVPILCTWSPVIEKLRNGADMMLPGLIPPFPSTVSVGSVVAIASSERPTVPLAVGVCNMNLASVSRVQGSHGKAVMIVQCYGDELPIKEKVTVPLQLDVTISRVVRDAVQSAPAERDTLMEAKASRADIGEVPPDVSSEPPTQPELETAQMAPVPRLSNDQSTFTTAEVDDAFRRALLSAIFHSRTSSMPLQLPQPASTFISAHLQTHLPAYFASVQLKQTSWKKAVRFLKAMEKEGLVTVKEKGGEVTITNIAGLDHVDIKGFKPFTTVGSKKPSRNGNNSDAGERTGGTVQVHEFYRLSEKSKLIAVALGKRTDEYYTMAELRTLLLAYIDKEELVDKANPREVRIDPVLAGLHSTATTRSRTLTRETLIDNLRQSCGTYYTITNSSANEVGTGKPKISKGAPPKVLVQVIMKQGHKMTRISHLEAYKIDTHELANELRSECASSTAVAKATEGVSAAAGGVPKLEILIQGQHSKSVVELLERRGMKKGWIDVKDGGKTK
ncbi:uncharacterized protein V1518DRAFT_410359 [Limtongia smithiae]|uniref:uncharacterized protein n=1 Tax=Limtongia smithiae TaxID=1125753 RepID=UPI0034CD2F3E